MAIGVTRIILGGSFISQNLSPGDADIAWRVNPNADYGILDGVFQSKEKRQARGEFLIDQKMDGARDVPYDKTHEYFLRTNNRVDPEFQDVGIVQIQFGD